MIKINHAEYKKLFDWFVKQENVGPSGISGDMWLLIDGEHVPVWVCREGTDKAEDIIEKLKSSQKAKSTSEVSDE